MSALVAPGPGQYEATAAFHPPRVAVSTSTSFGHTPITNRRSRGQDVPLRSQVAC